MFERCIYFNTNALARRLNERWDNAFARLGLAPSHGYLLRLVLERPGLSQQAIAGELRLEKSTVARFLDDLEKRGLVQRRRSGRDPRRNEIVPAPAARRMQKDLEALGDELYAEMCNAIGSAEVKAFVASARLIADRL